MEIAKKVLLALALATALLVVPASQARAEGGDQAAYTKKELNEQLVMALLWMQSSAEYRALCYQAFNMAAQAVDLALAEAAPGDKPLAVVADLDETLIDNSAYDVGLIGRDASYSGKTWLEWENAAKAKAVPGAVEFVQYAASKGVEVFYVTNRDQAGYEGTAANLAALDFPFVDSKHLLVSTGSSDKGPRFGSVSQDYSVVAYLGDNVNDTPMGTYHKGMAERNAIVDRNKDEFGTRYIVVPNPSYGDWESAIADGYFKLSPEGTSAARKSVLEGWVPAQP